jgi:hypothetical protein
MNIVASRKPRVHVFLRPEPAAPKATSEIKTTNKRGPESKPHPTKKDLRLGPRKNKILELDPSLGHSFQIRIEIIINTEHSLHPDYKYLIYLLCSRTHYLSLMWWQL